MTQTTLKRVNKVSELRRIVAIQRAAKKRIALVPTMGNLHAGHISLVDTARKHAEFVIVSVFVNPAQFGPNEDFSSYPRTLNNDTDMLKKANVDILFVPKNDEIYPPGFSTKVIVDGLTDCLCGKNRPHHFQGVTTVVTKLLLQAGPDVVVFGQKDYQQLQVIRHMVRDLDIAVEIEGSPTWREPDGLAMSSRNNYLDHAQRAVAPILNKVINEIACHAKDTKSLGRLLEDGKKTLLCAGVTSVDYLEIRDADSLSSIDHINQRNARVFVAAHLGKTRLIDNVAIT